MSMWRMGHALAWGVLVCEPDLPFGEPTPMMPQALHHVTLRPHDIDAARDFYRDVVQLKVGERPPFDFPGYWLYIADAPVIHLVDGSGTLDAYFGDAPSAGDTASGEIGGGAVDHVAFHYAPEDFEPVRESFERAGTPYHHQVVPGLGLRQIFVKDPDGVRVEMNFPAA